MGLISPEERASRLITPTQLALFSKSPTVGAWWEELDARGLFSEQRPPASELEEVLAAQGKEHEHRLVRRLQAEGRQVVCLQGRQSAADYDATISAMQSGAEFIFQASIRNDEMRGTVDLLRRVPGFSNLGAWRYQPIECKLAATAKTGFVLQACAYCEMLTPILGEEPEEFELYLGGGRFRAFANEDFRHWYRSVRDRYRDFRRTFDPAGRPENAPGDHGRWTDFIEQRLQADRDLSLVAGLRKSQREKLHAIGIKTVEELGAAPETLSAPGIRSDALAKLRNQARLQAKSATNSDIPAYELCPVSSGVGLAALPAPSPRDVWFDMEGYPDPIEGTKLEYLFGACYREGGEVQFQSWWAHGPEEEKCAFEGFVDWVEHRRASEPDLHIYHYAAYEKTAIRRLAQVHQTREWEIDDWLRKNLLIDLYPIVAKAIILGSPSYSIKKVESLYRSGRKADVASADSSVVAYQRWRESAEPGIAGYGEGQSPLLQSIEDYNREDCESTVQLHDWLLQHHRALGLSFADGTAPPANASSAESDDDAASTATRKRRDDSTTVLANARDQLLSDLPPVDGIGRLGLPRNEQILLAQLLGFHQREQNVSWWEYFERVERAKHSPEELEDDEEVAFNATLDSSSLDGRTAVYRFDPRQPLSVKWDDENHSLGLAPPNIRVNLKSFSRDRGEVVVSGRAIRAQLPQTAHLVLRPPNLLESLSKNLAPQAAAWAKAERRIPAAFAHLLSRTPVQGLIGSNTQAARSSLADVLAELGQQTLVLQGPPGTGKTTTTAKAICELAKLGRRIAVTSNSNAAIWNLLSKTAECARQWELDLQVGQYVTKPTPPQEGDVDLLPNKKLSQAHQIIGGTAWTLSKDQHAGQYDLLVVDEAGQLSLANLLTMARCAKSILLVGDQQQLGQPSKADHPGDSGLSCLHYAAAGNAVVPTDRGIFLDTSWRMEPGTTAVVSDIFYEGRLRGCPANTANRLYWPETGSMGAGGVLPTQGIVCEWVHHSDRGTSSPEEVGRLSELVDLLLTAEYSVHEQGEIVRRKMSKEDILVIAPYNAQVNLLKERLADRARVGTVDKFQGQEAAVSILSMTSSDGASAPRGLAFLLDANRMNVAISRARCMAIVVANEGLLSSAVVGLEDARRLNTLSRFAQASEFKQSVGGKY